MEATATSFIKILEDKIVFKIPLFQRPYSWKFEQVDQLINDIVRIGQRPELTHFIGSIVHVSESKERLIARISTILLIDGQQRLTTLSLILKAISELLPQEQQDVIQSYYLLNDKEKDISLRYKIQHSKKDRDDYIAIISGNNQQNQDSNLSKNYDHIRRKLLDYDPNIVYKGIEHMLVVQIALDRKADDPQLIFETLNSTGLDLTQSDLIRNYILMDFAPDKQDILYRDYWEPIEKRLYSEGLTDRFFRDYLTLKTGQVSPINQVYKRLKEYNDNCGLDKTEIIVELERYSRFYEIIALEECDGERYYNAIRDLNRRASVVVYPALLKIFYDYYEGTITGDDLIEIINTFESYILRRQIVGLPSRALTQVFTDLPKKIDISKYKDSIYYYLNSRKGDSRFPSDEEFIEALKVANVYYIENPDYFLEKIQNTINPKEPIDIDNPNHQTEITVEHIMPQTLNNNWKEMLGENFEQIHNMYLHTLGNLTLTGYNSEYSNRSFIEKKTMKNGFGESTILFNRDIALLDIWNEKTIIDRCNKLIPIIMKLWLKPVTNIEIKDEGPTIKVRFELPEEIQELCLKIINTIETNFKELTTYYHNTRVSFVYNKNNLTYIAIIPRINFLKIFFYKLGLNDYKSTCIKRYVKVNNDTNYWLIYKVYSDNDIDYVVDLTKQTLEMLKNK